MIGRLRGGFSVPLAPLALLSGIGVLLVIAPLVALTLAEPTPGLAGARVSTWEGFTDPVLRALLLRSGMLATTTALASLAVGVPVGLFVAVSRGRVGRALVPFHVLPLCLPPQVIALAWASLSGPRGTLSAIAGEAAGRAMSTVLYSETGFVLVLVVALSPAVTLLTIAFCKSVDPALIEAGLVSRRPGATLTRLMLPLAGPGIALGALVVFLLAFSEVAVPQLLRIQVYPTAVFARLSDLSFRPGEALSRAVPLLVVALLAAVAVSRLDRGGRAALGLRSNTAAIDLGGPMGWGCRVVLFAAVLMSVLPLSSLLWSALVGHGGGLSALAAAGPALGWSLAYGALAALLMVVIAVPGGYLWSRRPESTTLAALPALVGFVVPGVALALGTIVLWSQTNVDWVARTDVILILGLAARYLYLPMRTAKLGFDRIPSSWLEAASLHERSWLRRFLTVLAPATAGTLAVAWLLAFLVAIRDVETVVLLRAPGTETLPVRAMTLEVNSPPSLVAATAVLQLALAAAALAALSMAASAMMRRKPT